MAEKIPELSEAPPFDARTYSDRLQETRQAPGALPPVQVFDKTKPSSIVGIMDWLRGTLQDKVETLIAYVNQHDSILVAVANKDAEQDRRLSELEAARVPFGSRSG